MRPKLQFLYSKYRGCEQRRKAVCRGNLFLYNQNVTTSSWRASSTLAPGAPTRRENRWIAVGSERNLVVEVGPAAARGCAAAARATAAAGGLITPAFIATPAAALAARIEQRELASEALEHDFGRVLLGPALIGPFAGLELALEINLGT